jgi:hypothetical protein
MNRCPNCAAQNRDGAKFCTSCGFRLPAESAPLITSDRSPFATTSTVPPYAAPMPESAPDAAPPDDSGFGTWSTPPAEEPAPGLSWNAGPPPDTGVPVNDDMIAALVRDPELANGDVEDEPMQSPAPATASRSREVPFATSGNRSNESSPTVDHLLSLVRDLEYGLVELAEAPQVVAGGDARLLANALADLQDEADLASLRNAVATAQERPRDVDVMLDLVLRADAISTLLTERDQLKSAVALFLEDASDSAESDDSSTDEDVIDDTALDSLNGDVADDEQTDEGTQESADESR